MRTLYKIIVVIAVLIFSGHEALAQTTPQGYCTNVSGCEVLGIKLGGANSNTGYTTALIEYCRANKYSSAMMSMYPPYGSSTGQWGIYAANYGSYSVYTSTSLPANSAAWCALQYYDSVNGVNKNILP